MSDQATAPASAPVKERPRQAGGDTVTIGCKLPSGFVLQLFQMEPSFEPVLGGGMRETQRARKVGDDYPLNGYGFNILEASKGNLPGHSIVGGFGITNGVPREVWDKWYKDNEKSALVQNRVIFVADNESAAKGIAMETASVKSGFEPIDPDNPSAKSPDFRRIAKGTLTNSDVDNL